MLHAPITPDTETPAPAEARRPHPYSRDVLDRQHAIAVAEYEATKPSPEDIVVARERIDPERHRAADALYHEARFVRYERLERERRTAR